jgi:phospholipase/carboxylesterase
MQPETTLTHIELNPSTPPVGTVIWMHGLGADGNDFVPIVDELHLPKNLPLRFIFPNAPERPVTLNNGYIMRAWFDIESLNTSARIDHEGISDSIEDIQHFIEKEHERGIPYENIILAGFSQGAVMAMLTGLQFSKKLGGIIALSGYLPSNEKIQFQAANQSTAIFLAHGSQDPVVPFLLGEMTKKLLVERHYSVDWHAYNMPHSVCLEEIKDISEWLQKRIPA